jgi:hypothetical protein
MTPGEWASCTDPLAMLQFLRGNATDRKLRLFACACFGRRRDLLTERKDRGVVKLAELYADARIGSGKLSRAFVRAGWGYDGRSPEYRSINWYREANQIAQDSVRVLGGDSRPERMAMCGLLREMVGDPFTEVKLAPSWLTGPVLSLARQGYDARDFSVHPVLADALEEASCADAVILDHCRRPGEHVRGCWVLDLLLGKS